MATIEIILLVEKLLSSGVPKLIELIRDFKDAHANGRKPTEAELQSILSHHRADHEVYEEFRRKVAGGVS